MSRFNANLAPWEATGTKPPDSTIQNGWLAGTKPPADWFNWYFNSTYTALKELQELAALNADLINHTGNTNNPHSVTKAQLGLSDVENFGIASLDEAKAGIASNKLMTPASVLAAIKERFNTQNILFEGAAWPSGNTYKFANSQKVSDQNLGLIFIWSDYDVIPGSASVANNYNFDFTFIPKFFVDKHAGANINVPVATNFNAQVAQITIKTLYLTDTTFAGHDLNSSGLNANDAILRYILGV
ncbi:MULTISPECIES: hypothetical protein [Listeria]|uniref:gp26 n=1 Tax=Listeria phage B054 TaxID=330397 RepID=UPI00015C0429|nr:MULTISPECIES: hypothetical protein [Listeria]YP_001468730.1 gp26 [Listeria phage B054]EBB6230772.1 hypothetical protein [Listeria innocua]MDA56060.1 hypothetical protein [Listeria monocytogenes serotype 4b]AAY53131.1 gp26 [Listeria phage B054]ASD76033.1 hypothetical protein ARX15_08745 [Listeria monocytogenes]ASW39452.1 hypothetical protein B1S31_08755 [Listeria monocytogenes]